MPALLRQILVVIAVLAMITVNGLANALPINGQQTGEISDRFDVLFVPAGYVFSIWGLIYAGLLVYAGYQALPRTRGDPDLRGVDGLVILGCLANGAWIFAWHHELFVVSIALMLVLLGSLIGVYLRLDVGRGSGGVGRRWCVELPFSIYLGWITVATIANASVVLRDLGWGGFGLSDPAWLVIMLAVALAIAAVVAFTRRDLAYLAVLVWAFVGIAVEHAGARSVASVAPIAAGVSAAVVVGLGLAAALTGAGRARGDRHA